MNATMVSRRAAGVGSIAWTALAAGLVAATGAAADVVVLESVLDNTLYHHPEGLESNGKGANMFTGVNGLGQARRALMAFDLSGAIPPGSCVTGVKLKLSVTQTVSPASVVTVHRVTAPWGEGGSNASGNEGQGAPSQPGDATWLHRFFPDMLWDNEGGDFIDAESASLVVGSEGLYTWDSSGLVVLAQSWLDDPANNFGIIVIGDESASTTAKRFNTHENATASTRPMLEVTFDPPCYADCDSSTGKGTLDFFDFICFQDRFSAGDPYACDCDTSTGPLVCDFFDFICFQDAFAGGCP